MEHIVAPPMPDLQEEIIERYCTEARQLLLQAASREEALAIRTRVCSKLAQECGSLLILDATHSYIDQVILEMWSRPDGSNNR